MYCIIASLPPPENLRKYNYYKNGRSHHTPVFISHFPCDRKMRSLKYCQNCRARKVRCTGPPVCRLCFMNNIACVFTRDKASIRSPKINQALWMEINVQQPGIYHDNCGTVGWLEIGGIYDRVFLLTAQ